MTIREHPAGSTNYSVVSTMIRCELGEGPVWIDETHSLFWVDILCPTVHRLNVADGRLDSWPMPENIGWLIPRKNDSRFIIGLRTGFAELSLEPFAFDRFGQIPDHLEDARLRLNDAKADSQGRIFAGTMDMDGVRSGHLYRLDADRSWTIVDSGYGIANGPTFSPRFDVIYHTDSRRRVVHQFDLRPDGTLANKRPFVEFPEGWGVPDGMTTDVDGGVWIAHWGGSRVSRFTPDGKLDRSIALPTSQITSCVFGGPGLRRMYVTSAACGISAEPLAGAVFEIDPGCQGVPAHSFSG